MTSALAVALLLARPLAADGERDAPRLIAPADVDAVQLSTLAAAVAAGASAAHGFLGAVAPGAAATAADVRFGASHEALGVELGRSVELLDDASVGPVTFTCGSGEPKAGDDALRGRAFRAGALAVLRARAPDVAPARRAALAEALLDPSFAGDALARTAALARAGVALDPQALAADRRSSPELLRVVEGSLLATVLADGRDGAARVAAWRAPDLARWRVQLESAPPRTPKRPPPPTGLRGFCFAHEGYGWVDGYGSRAAAQSLAVARDCGANAVSLTPFAFQRDAALPSILLLHERSSGRFAPETDAAVAASAADAAALGLTVVLKPHLWCGNHRWCGEIAMGDDAAWAGWFAEYERVALHYALLAQRLHLPIFAVATELKGTTAHAKEWRALLARVRAVYDGSLTYCANWGDEVTTLAFWDAFDAIGVSAYWPLVESDDATIESAAARFRTLLRDLQELARRQERPLWFLEAGFPDVKAPWRSPHRHDGEPDGGVDQGRAYALVLDATAQAHFPDGLFWWKWPSSLEALPATGRHDYWPCGRAAEDVLRRAWGREPGRR